MIRLWVPTAITESSLLDIILLAACRHLSIAYRQGSQEQQRIFQQLTFQYKSQSLQALRHAISAEMPMLTDSTVAKAIMLAYDEVGFHPHMFPAMALTRNSYMFEMQKCSNIM